MRLNYSPIGNYIQQVKAKNTDGSISLLRGVSIEKFYMPSVANINGVDLKKYKVVTPGQFAFNPMHVGRDRVLPISLLRGRQSVIVSPAYTVFEITNNELLPDYLMMWFRRPEFDRNAWFKTDGNVRGGLSWDDFCEIELPVPSPAEQIRIVKEYETVSDRIMLNKQLNIKLEEAAQTIYKLWFVDFEFPMSSKYAESIGKPELTGKPYGSNGGQMVFSDELKKDIPKDWKVSSLVDITSYIKRGITPSYVTSGGITVINQRCIRDRTLHLNFARLHSSEKKIDELRHIQQFDVLINSTGVGTLGRVAVVKDPDLVSVVDAHVTIARRKSDIDPIYFWRTFASLEGRIENLAEGSTGQTELTVDNLATLLIPIAPPEVQKSFAVNSQVLVNYSHNLDVQKRITRNLQELLPQRMVKI